MNKIVKLILRGLNLDGVAYNYMAKHLKKKSHSDLTYVEAIRILETLSHNPNNSSICYHQWGNPDCDLEIVVPCYNVEKYVEECIDSILSQRTRFSFFTTIINDGSKDSTREVLRKYECIPNVRVIDQNNIGLSGARNKGISQLHGRYVMFLDSDDVLLPNAIENLMSVAIKTNADITDSGHIRFADPKTAEGLLGNIKNTLYNKVTKPFNFPYNENATDMTSLAWGKVIRREVLRNVQFPEAYWFEDACMWMIVKPMCRRIATIDKLCVKYRMNPNSICHRLGEPKAIDTVYVTLQMLSDREILGVEMTQWEYDTLLLQMRYDFRCLMSFSEDIQYAGFVINRDVICNRFSEWKAERESVKPIEDLLSANDFEGFRLWCEWH